ncbi:MAG: protein-methionine-sulfoxide reductase heme-binding subunit MsrQ [Gammaproteobacteria bacterium]|nr:MAG: protein-methionine-sulfoxide reductase heme-binding subunit MsrQ [Gammaproteobacteria bacterium]
MFLIAVSNPRLIKIILFFLCLIPLAWLVWRGLNAELGANPVETVTRYTGDWTLRFLFITLSVTPARRLLGWKSLLRYRRMLGLFSFFYASIHFSIYVIDQYFSVETIVEDILKRPYITVGFGCFILLIPLAITSANNMIRRLGAKRWQQLHRLVYVVAIGGVLHFLWLVKSDISGPLLYGTLLCGLLGYRVWNRYNQKQA